MSINPISGIENMASIAPLSNAFGSDKYIGDISGEGGFSDILSQAIGNAIETEQADQAGMVGLLSGADIEPHTVMIESTQAEMALNLAIQIRNKVVDAYNEIMRMQV